MIALNDEDSATLASLAQYENLPSDRKRILVNRLSKKAKPIGKVLAGQASSTSSKELDAVVKHFKGWTASNQASR